MPQVFTVEFNAIAVTAQQDFFELTPADDRPIKIIGIFLGQYTEFGDAQDESLSIRVIRGFTASGSGGSTATPRPVEDRNAAAAGFTCEINNTTVATTGTTHSLHSDAWSVRGPYGFFLPDGCGWGLTQADTTIVVRLNSTPADSITMNGCLYVAEG